MSTPQMQEITLTISQFSFRYFYKSRNQKRGQLISNRLSHSRQPVCYSLFIKFSTVSSIVSPCLTFTVTSA